MATPLKTILITGSTGGIGIETAIGVAKKGARVLVTARNPAKGAKGVERIQQESGNENIHLYLVDFTQQQQIRAFVAEVKNDYPVLDGLINNVGGGSLERGETEEGIEATFALNHLSHYMVTHLLLDRLAAAPSARIINVTSGLHHFVKFDFEDIHTVRNYLLPFAYAKAKLANLMWAYHLARELEGSTISVNMVDPGLSMTEGLDALIGQVDQFNLRWLNPMYYYMRQALPANRAAKSTIYLATSHLLGDMNGAYISPEKKVISPAKSALKVELQEQISELSASLTGVPFALPIPS